MLFTLKLKWWSIELHCFDIILDIIIRYRCSLQNKQYKSTSLFWSSIKWHILIQINIIRINLSEQTLLRCSLYYNSFPFRYLRWCSNKMAMHSLIVYSSYASYFNRQNSRKISFNFLSAARNSNNREIRFIIMISHTSLDISPIAFQFQNKYL